MFRASKHMGAIFGKKQHWARQSDVQGFQNYVGHFSEKKRAWARQSDVQGFQKYGGRFSENRKTALSTPVGRSGLPKIWGPFLCLKESNMVPGRGAIHAPEQMRHGQILLAEDRLIFLSLLQSGYILTCPGIGSQISLRTPPYPRVRILLFWDHP